MLSQPALQLRLTDRKTLLRHLNQLGAADAARRAQAALDAADLLHRKGIAWEALIPLDRDGVQAADNWPDLAVNLLANAGLTDEERVYAKKVSAWRSPGAACLNQLQAIANRVAR